jgi:FkbM family methyltransferase
MMITRRTRALNALRSLFKIPPLERWLASTIRGNCRPTIFDKLAPNPYQYAPGSMRIFKHKGISMEVDLSDYLGHFYYFGFFDAGYHRLFALCRPGTIVVDVGANLGWTSLHLKDLSKTGIVIAFEPDSQNYARCSRNLSLNPLLPIELHQLGLGEVDIVAEMEIRCPTNLSGNRVLPSGSHGGEQVVITSLDQFLLKKRIGGIQLIKIDVEGYEVKVLKGARNLLTEYRPTIFVEINTRNLLDQGDSAEDLFNLLLDYGYTKFECAQTGCAVTRDTFSRNSHFDLIASAK